VRAGQLAFDGAETEMLLTRFVGRPATPAFCDRVHERTEGWVAGVRLAGVAVENGSSTEHVLACLDAAQGTVAEVLVEEVLRVQPTDVRRFLLDTAVLDVLDPEACRALSGRADADVVLRRLAADHLFIRPLEGVAHRYRHHHLLAELLRAELRLEDPLAPERFHRAASAWYEQAGDPASAIEHALAAGDFERAVAVLVERREDLHNAGYGRSMARWLAAVPDRFITADPERAIDHASTMLVLARPETQRWLRAALPLIPADAKRLRARALRIEAVLYASIGRRSDLERLLAAAADLDDCPATDPMIERADAWRARLLSFDGRHDEAIDLAERVLASDRRVLRDDVATSVLAGVLADAGELDRAAGVADRAIEWWHADGSPEVFGMVDALRARAHVHRLTGRLADAAELLDQASAMLVDQNPHLVSVLLAIESAATDVDVGRATQAVARLDRLEVDVRNVGHADALLERIARARRGAAAAVGAPRRPAGDPVDVGFGQRLTDRELVVLRLLSSHLTLPEIAGELSVSRNTVKTQVGAIYRKLGVSSRSDAVDAARLLGLIS
jgi:LuxR family maltose regulon positive regulatory protein